jgi:hypothetical protein
MVEMRNAYKILVGKPERKKPFGTSRRTWKDINKKPVYNILIKMDIKEIIFEGVDRIHLA